MEDNKIKKNDNVLKIIMAVVVIILIISLCVYVGYKGMFNKNIENAEISTSGTNIEVKYSNSELTGEWKDYTAKITLDDSKIKIEGSGVENSGNTIKITSGRNFLYNRNFFRCECSSRSK